VLAAGGADDADFVRDGVVWLSPPLYITPLAICLPCSISSRATGSAQLSSRRVGCAYVSESGGGHDGGIERCVGVVKSGVISLSSPIEVRGREVCGGLPQKGLGIFVHGPISRRMTRAFTAFHSNLCMSSLPLIDQDHTPPIAQATAHVDPHLNLTLQLRLANTRTRKPASRRSRIDIHTTFSAAREHGHPTTPGMDGATTPRRSTRTLIARATPAPTPGPQVRLYHRQRDRQAAGKEAEMAAPSETALRREAARRFRGDAKG